MTDDEAPEFSDLDVYIRTQLTGAAERHASSIDLDARLKTILETGTERKSDDGAVDDS